jgi:hypothetical protein
MTTSTSLQAGQASGSGGAPPPLRSEATGGLSLVGLLGRTRAGGWLALAFRLGTPSSSDVDNSSVNPRACRYAATPNSPTTSNGNTRLKIDSAVMPLERAKIVPAAIHRESSRSRSKPRSAPSASLAKLSAVAIERATSA